ncbi:Eukaryotic translation initiation factor 5A [Mortierella sp. AD094]|nr:Eukaryotic translation initiation factor 5A [Mortierella sp. AD094]
MVESTKACSVLRKGDYVVIQTRPGKIDDISQDHGKIHLTASDIFTHKKFEGVYTPDEKMVTPTIQTTEIELEDVSDDDFYYVKSKEGVYRRIKAPDDDVGVQILEHYGNDKEETLILTVLSTMGLEGIVGFKVAPASA